MLGIFHCFPQSFAISLLILNLISIINHYNFKYGPSVTLFKFINYTFSRKFAVSVSLNIIDLFSLNVKAVQAFLSQHTTNCTTSVFFF